MRILILGIDGYLGWALANTLTKENIEVFGIDSFFRRKWVKEMNSLSAVPIASMNNRIKSHKKIFNKEIVFYKGDITNYNFLSSKIKEIKPDVIVHFAQCPSAPYSMMNQEKSAWVQSNNLIGTLNLIYAVKEHVPEAHIIKLGTMGEYGTPNIDIAEGFFEIEYRGRKDVLPFPRQANSWYHLSKVHDSNNLQFACRNYGIRCTDIMQGVVFGFYPGENNIDKHLYTRLDFDQAFGTSINRFCCESVISHAITVYGDGTQRRSFLPLRDSMKCIELVIKNPPRQGEYKVVNQFANVHSINDLALKVAGVCKQLNMDVNIVKMKNPRKEAALHYYNPDNQNLKNLGYNPTTDFEQEILALIQGIKPYKKRIQLHSNILNPTIKW
jgi:UDP-sulfoquinovose synthase